MRFWIPLLGLLLPPTAGLAREDPFYIDSRGVAVALTEAPVPIAGVGLTFLDEGGQHFGLDRGVIVKLARGLAELPGALLAPAQLTPVRSLDRAGTTFLCEAPDARRALSGSRVASGLPLVRWAVPDFLVPVRLAFTPNDTYYNQQWYLAQSSGHHIAAEEAWDVTLGDAAIIVAVIDTGLDRNHPDFAGTHLVTGYDVVDFDSDATPASDAMSAHGTHCGGLIAATSNNGTGMAGLCPQCSLMPIRMMDGWGGGLTQISQIVAAFNYAGNNGAGVISNSWSISVPPADLQAVKDAIVYLVQNGRDGKGTVVLFSSGNGDENANALPIATDDLANLPEIMAVGGTDYQDSWVTYSNYGPNLSVAAPTGWFDTLNNPDTFQIVSTDSFGNSGGTNRGGSYWASYGEGQDFNAGWPQPDSDGHYTRYFNGTSAACPIAAGVVALTLAANPALTGAQARYVVEHTADQVGGVSYDANGHHDQYGYGRINAGRAARAAEVGFDQPTGAACAESFNCADNDCQKAAPDDFHGYCGGALGCDVLPDGSACNDNSRCSFADKCQGGVCQGTAKACADNDNCTTDGCEPTTGTCTHAPISCPDDGNPCTSEACSTASGACVATERDCADTSKCTDDACNPATGACTHLPVDCADTNPCTTDSCISTDGSCRHEPVTCSDGDPCTIDSCNPTTGACAHAAKVCDDGDLCTSDSCNALTGACEYTPTTCDDGNPCTDDSCSAGTGECLFTPSQATCDDGDPCTAGDACAAGACAGTPLDCSAFGGVCAQGSCNPTTGQCQQVLLAYGAACDDGDPCTTGDSCQAGQCLAGPITCQASGGCGCATARTSLPLTLVAPLLLLGRWRRRRRW